MGVYPTIRIDQTFATVIKARLGQLNKLSLSYLKQNCLTGITFKKR